MITEDKVSSVVFLSFVVIITLLSVSVITKFTLLDFAYLLFLVGCFIRFIYIKTH